MEVLLFAVGAALSVAGGLGVVAARQPVHSALSLLLVLGSLAVLYLTLAAEFLAVLQVIVYAGAIVVLFLFVIMLLHARTPESRPSPLGGQWSLAVPLGAALWAGLSYAVLQLPAATHELPPEFGSTEAVGRELFSRFLLPFEVASLLLLVGIVAAVVLGSSPAPPSVPPRSASGREEA
ncbi:MAG: NADH-quinone oxidoreductase subunit J [Armatimonadota bacterium]|nr:NADH-quinone oxidoreductase subunit J [Armatimonadota bacterium]MDR5675367.1 NADH-quinone oxidoreductase subunit J [Armatimonadota bacterium]MDR5688648.1 NADH-quinone oxidoreductase subunit J [Armatimonadota bacterium]MDR7385839.1 NADH-quinone oxidoreductase subunit J [Armatimonadota bacterium]MDR7388419.1 NADH-quinone oxidoreductase subunit J [Armatimonadota bacterium]